MSRTIEWWSGGTSYQPDDGGTYTLHKVVIDTSTGLRTATAVDTATTSSGSVSVDVPNDMPIGGLGFETWDVTFNSGAAVRFLNARVIVSTSDLSDAPVTSQVIDTEYAGYTTRIGGASSWDTQITKAWSDVLRALVLESQLAGNAAIFTPEALWDPCYFRTHARIAQYDSNGANQEAQARMEMWDAKYQAWKATGRVRFDTDGDGVGDTGPTTFDPMGQGPNQVFSWGGP